MLLICPVLALHEAANAEISFIRRESAVTHHRDSSSALHKEQVYIGGSGASSPVSVVANTDEILLSSVTNNDNIHKAFNITFEVRFDKDALLSSHVPLHNHMMLLKTDNDAIEIEAYGAHYAPNDRKIVASMRTASGLPAPGGKGVHGIGKKHYDSNGDLADVSNQDDGKLYSQQLPATLNGTEWHKVSFAKTHGTTGNPGKLMLTVDDNTVEVACPDQILGFQEQLGHFDMMQVPDMTKIEYGPDAGAGDIGLQGEIRGVTVVVPAASR